MWCHTHGWQRTLLGTGVLSAAAPWAASSVLKVGWVWVPKRMAVHAQQMPTQDTHSILCLRNFLASLSSLSSFDDDFFLSLLWVEGNAHCDVDMYTHEMYTPFTTPPFYAFCVSSCYASFVYRAWIACAFCCGRMMWMMYHCRLHCCCRYPIFYVSLPYCGDV